MNTKKTTLLILLLLQLSLASGLVSCTCLDRDRSAAEQALDLSAGMNSTGTGPGQTIEAIQEQEPLFPLEPEPVEIIIAAVGDIMVHSPQINAQYNKKTGAYDFTNNFQFVKPYIQRSDLALANLEATLAGKEKGYSGYPFFNSPDALADALKDTGFNVLSTANNHSIDSGEEGLTRTIKVLQDRKLGVIGTRSSEEEQGFLIEDVKGIKVGISAYTYETPQQDGYKALNGIPMYGQLEKLVDSFSYENLDEDLLKMKERVEKKRRLGAELIIFYLHWGNEYQREADAYQKKMARALADFGVDIIFGSHPHVLQPLEFIHSANRERETLVVYSLGNFISNQRYETLGNRYTEDGIIILTRVKKDFVNDQLLIEKVSYIPTWVHRYTEQDKWVYEILPLPDALASQSDYNLNSETSIWRAENSQKTTASIIESSLLPVMQTPRILPGK